ncbi:ABC transporter substrate-binding protein [Paenibacillus fonticola]|uniref:ABC transporter substrate-binding protein n=1 Tax=Paenibacillus fonticola TaxID=379896 RepID=UPI000379AE3A|nr:extracellular solute-binding protein [Paenibacillus fonticola]
MRKKSLFIAVILSLACILLLSCSNHPQNASVSLKIMYDNSDEFFRKYGNVFLTKFPEYQIDVIPLDQYYKDGLTNEEFNNLVESEMPDIILVNNIQNSINEGLLLDLDPFIDKDSSLNEISENIMSYLRKQGEGSLYVISPTFTGQALYYNKDMFDHFNIEYPTDQMTWDDVFLLASKFSNVTYNNTTSYGFYYNGTNLFSLATDIALSSQMTFTDRTGNITLYSDRWKRIIEIISSSVQQGSLAIGEKSQGEPYADNLFFLGNAAMTTDYSNAMTFFSKASFDWDLVTIPVDPSTPDQSASIHVNNMFGIYSKSNHSEAAFKFLEFICSKDFAHTMLRSGINDQLIANEDVVKEMDKLHNLEAFYKLRPIDMVYPFIPLHFGTKMYELGDEAIRSIIEGEKDLDTAMKQLQEESQYLLEYEKKNETE